MPAECVKLCRPAATRRGKPPDRRQGFEVGARRSLECAHLAREPDMRRFAGFTLIEVMVVVAIVGILATVGYPAYTDYLRRGKIAEAVSTLAEARAKLEQYFLDNRTYVGADGATSPATRPCSTAGKKNFTYACANLGAGDRTI